MQQERALESHRKCWDSAAPTHRELPQQWLISDLENTPGKVDISVVELVATRNQLNIEFSYKRIENVACLCIWGFLALIFVFLCAHILE